jgi:hypothetical protein
MRSLQKWVVPIAILLAVVALFAVATWSEPTAAESVISAPGAKSGHPAWVKSDGAIDRSKLPPCFKIVGSDGKIVTDANGQPLCGKPFDEPSDEAAEEKAKRAVPSGAEVPYKRPPGVPASPNDPPQR